MNSKVILKLDNDYIPPLGYYKPDYNYVKPRISATCFSKARERKTIFDLEKSPKGSEKLRTRIFSANKNRNPK